MSFKPLGGKSRQFLNTETGEIISRRQYDKIRGIQYEAKAAANKKANLAEALARPARGRKKAESKAEAELRAEAARIRQQIEEEEKQKKKLLRAASSRAHKVKPKKIRKAMLKAGHRAERVSFTEYEEYVDYIAQMKSNVLPNGRRLVSSYAIGMVGYDERDEKELGAMLTGLQSPSVKLTEEELRDLSDDFIISRPYFVFSHYFLHLHFDKPYAEGKYQKLKEKEAREKRKNIPKQYRTQKKAK